MSALTIIGLGSLLIQLSLNFITGWDLSSSCPGETAFCEGVYWTAAVDYAPYWLFVSQLLIVFAMISPVALISTGR